MTVSGIRIREMRASERGALLQLIAALAAYEVHFEDDRTGDVSLNAAYLQEIEREIATRGGFILVVTEEPDDRSLIGYANVVYRTDGPFIIERYRRYAYITDLYVADHARGQGVGQALIADVKRRVHATGILRVGVGALVANTVAGEAYRKSGFRPYAIDYVLDLDRG